MTQEQFEQVQEALRTIREGIQIADVELSRIKSVLETSDRNYNAAVDRLSKVGL